MRPCRWADPAGPTTATFTSPRSGSSSVPGGRPSRASSSDQGRGRRFDQAGWGIPRAIDGNPATAWGIHPAVGQSHQAVFAFDPPSGSRAGPSSPWNWINSTAEVT